MSDVVLLRELEPTVERLLERHLAMTKEWFPHQLVPYERGRSGGCASEPWSAADADIEGVDINDAVRSALLVNVLTEDNLPYYFDVLRQRFGISDGWLTWARRWTAEEARHSMVIYGYLMATRAVDPVMLERARMVQVSTGVVPQPATVADGMVYVALQELATRLAHRNTGQRLDAAGYLVMKQVAADENLHHLFYRDLVSAAIELDPSTMMLAIEQQVSAFEMPGSGIPDFARHAAAIAREGIYDLAVHHDHVLVPTVERSWRIDDLDGLDADAEQARDRLHARMQKGARVAKRLTERRADQTVARSADSRHSVPRSGRSWRCQ
jgi:acyl-[acyl-carrier-protein] desaturase